MYPVFRRLIMGSGQFIGEKLRVYGRMIRKIGSEISNFEAFAYLKSEGLKGAIRTCSTTVAPS
jgi:hypothetical protein